MIARQVLVFSCFVTTFRECTTCPQLHFYATGCSRLYASLLPYRVADRYLRTLDRVSLPRCICGRFCACVCHGPPTSNYHLRLLIPTFHTPDGGALVDKGAPLPYRETRRRPVGTSGPT
ncbi:hypothetical protein C8R47DRAFT_1092034 [Mycena vitilis]|nr:hypothetical protein C8R47DRAFT_1092034 [Mycena vitilis]